MGDMGDKGISGFSIGVVYIVEWGVVEEPGCSSRYVLGTFVGAVYLMVIL